MKVQIIATVSNGYNIENLKSLSGVRPIIANPDGSFEFTVKFSTISKAIKFLKIRAYKLYSNHIERKKAIADINKYGIFIYDNCIATIVKI